MKSDETKRHLSLAFLELLDKRPIGKISISDITVQCSVSRMTFYYHFRDIYDLAGWTLENELGQAIDQNREMVSWQQRFMEMLNALKPRKRLLLNLKSSFNREFLERFILGEFQKLLMPVIEACPISENVDREDQECVCAFYSYALMGIVLKWISEGMVQRPEALARQVSAIMEGGFENSLSKLIKR
ncbi:MAG: TetR/AcrR family transcriptional regulator C-terminal domain-containing protein [Clostridia bacterium]|nr:TetR/AcrR family transcriptional regulator C-terminal domain-containing protein [Clostridia bacterium]MBR6008129.1 TetR/AcrR family transcriptional regulator C-terminal domain-containing protein [Clostridia bacterium]MBR6499360.1 TetR/AcrR family transcriptional regulator C-terminal domain-containing protein [Clostridia bacterium]